VSVDGRYRCSPALLQFLRHPTPGALQASRKFENQDTEAVLLRAGAEDTQSQRMFSQDISIDSSPQDSDPTCPPPSALPAAARASRFSLESGLHAKPFVPKSLQKVSMAAHFQSLPASCRLAAKDQFFLLTPCG